MSLCFRVTIWQPFAFYILPNSANPSKTAFSSLIRKLLILKLTSSFFFFMKIRTTLHNFFEIWNNIKNYLLLPKDIVTKLDELDDEEEDVFPLAN